MARTYRLIAVLLAAAALLPAAAQAAGPNGTRKALASQMRSAGGGSGALAIDLDSGSQIFATRPDVPRMPASVNKLFTTASALSLYGPEGHLTTGVLGDGVVDPGGLLAGNLYVHGGGDPTFGTRQLAELADTLVQDQGLREITGRVIGDESAFDTRRGPPSEGYRTTFEVGGPLSALTFNRGRTGKRRPYFQTNPGRFVAQQLDRALRRRGVAVDAAPRAGRTPQLAQVLAEHPSPTLAELARVTNQPSDNFMAETLIKALGSEFGTAGSTRAGAVVVRRTMQGFGLSPIVVDGSGLSRSDRTTPRQVVTLLDHMSLGRRRRRVRELAGGRRAQRHALRPHAPHRGARPLPRQDRHAARRLRAGRLLRDRGGLARGLRDPHERRQPVRGPPSAGPHGLRARALLALTLLEARVGALDRLERLLA